MKKRNGFVSNSSSSSFVIACNQKLNKRLLMIHLFPNIQDTLLGGVANVISKLLVQLPKEFNTFEQYKKEYWVQDNSKIMRIFDKYKHVYFGDAADDTDETIESLICQMDIHYDTKELYVEKQSGY